MSAKADAEAAAALRELGATLKASTNAPKLHTLKLLHDTGGEYGTCFKRKTHGRRGTKRGEKEKKRHHSSAQQQNTNNHVPTNSPQGIPHSGY